MSTRSNPGDAPVEAWQDEGVVFIKDLLGVLWRRLWVIALLAVVLAIAVVALDSLRTPKYEASIKVVVGQEQQAGDLSSNLVSDVQGLQQLALTVAQVLPTRPVADAVIQRLGLDMTPEDLLGNLSVKQAGATQVIDVSYRDPDPERAQQIVNTVGDVFSEQVSNLSPNANAVTATVWEQAALPDSPVSPTPLRDGLVALVIGGVLGVGLAFLLEQLDDRWRSPEEVERISGAPTFGVVREFGGSKVKKVKTDAYQEETDESLNFPPLISSGSSKSRRSRRAKRKKGLLSWLVSG